MNSLVTSIFLIALVGCVSVPHVDPQTRSENDQAKTVVIVESDCPGYDYHLGTGVVISERYILTAAHVTECPDIPDVHITLYDGVRHRVAVIKENLDEDISKLEVFHAGRLHVDVAPPKLNPAPWHPQTDDWVCVWTRGGRECALRVGEHIIAEKLKHGDSGSPVYDNGFLLGLAVSIFPEANATRFTTVTSDWLEGT